ncbi:class I SAM-dependent methyltransferase [Streptomyces sp. NPDC060031]|uniref:class I SAM-dependent methyltransferase n=1 Tax=Streptomyces sp. NPDC060031 TaxID=3347043 RepID=UPI0036AAF5DF
MTITLNPRSADEVRALPYVALLAMLEEANLPPGGLDSVRRICQEAHLRPGLDVLHAGCNAGFLSREVARRTGASVLGIDISPDMADAGNRRAAKEGLDGLVRHENRDMRRSGLADASFDVVLSGGALAFVDGRQDAVQEWLRVVKPYGLVADVELYYAKEPPRQVLTKVSEMIEVEVPRYDRDYWVDLFTHERLQPYYRYDAEAGARSDAEVDAYCAAMVRRSAADWAPEAQEALHERLLEIFRAFNENMKYLSYTLFVQRVVPAADEPALYL